ncbi:MAG: DUF4179 domain-containing protein [Dehalococcoidales bacterium]|nr:DUF4179 domain-containing protein [Dehalococcoidales bacterium]
MELNRMEQELRDFFKAEVRQAEPSKEWWDRIVNGLKEGERLSFRQGFRPRTRLAWALLVLLALFVLGGTAYAATRVVQELFASYAGHIEEAGLAQELDIEQTIGDNITVRLERAYADGNQVIVGYTVSGPEERYFTRGGKLITDTGETLPEMFGMGFVPGSDRVMSEWRPSDRLAYLAGYDACSIKGAPSSLNLTLEIQVGDPPQPDKPLPTFDSCTFNFSVPFTPATGIEVRQTADTANTTIILERIEIAPSGVNAFLQIREDANPLISVKLPDGNSVNESSGQRFRDDPVAYRAFFMGDFTGQHGEWTLEISALMLPPEPEDVIEKIEIEGGKGWFVRARENRLAGPWTFTFNVP